MDDLYAINSAETEFREAFNTGDPERLIALLDPAFVYMPDGVPAANGADAADAIRAQFRELTARYNVQLLPIIIEIRIQDSVAWDYGWHTWKKTPRDGGSQVTVKNRYVDIWRKNEKGEWKLWMYMNNTEVPMQTPNGGLISEAY
jgi:ketosteroid isomerase-like protein